MPRRLCLALCALATVWLTVGVDARMRADIGAPAGALSGADIRRAVDFGLRGNPKPYPIFVLKRNGQLFSSRPAGYVYTPFVRIALHAKTIADRGLELDVEGLDPLVTTPLVFLVGNLTVQGGARAAAFNAAPIDVRAVLDGRRPGNGGWFEAWRPKVLSAVAPTWTRDVAMLRRLGIEPPHGTAIVAAFPPAILRRQPVFVLRRQATDLSAIVSDMYGPAPDDPSSLWR